MKFGKILKELRLEQNLSQVELAKRAQLAPSCIAMLESESRTPTANTLIQLSAVLHVSVDYLLGLSDEGIHFGGKVETTPAGGNTAEERELLEDYHELSKEGKELVKATIKTLLGSARSGKVKKA